MFARGFVQRPALRELAQQQHLERVEPAGQVVTNVTRPVGYTTCRVSKIATDLLWLALGVYVGALIWREGAILLAPYAPSVSKAMEFPFGTGMTPASS